MQCLKCGKDGVFNVNATDVTEGGGCTITCVHCGAEHYTNLCYQEQTLSLPPSWRQSALITAIVVGVLGTIWGAHQLIQRLF